MASDSEMIESFEKLRPMLWHLAYRMLGSRSDADDVLQDAYLKWRAAHDVRDDRAFLTTTVTRLCIDFLRSARHRREQYVGPWLPEPIVGTDVPPEDFAEVADSLSMAFLTILERLAPRERAAFLLREVFVYPYDELAQVLGTSEDNVRQLVHRSSKHIRSGRRRFEPDSEKQRNLTERFLLACISGEIEPLIELLGEDAVLYTDGGGRVKAARNPIYGRAKIARFLVGIIRDAPEGITTRFETVNGWPGIVLEIEGKQYGVVQVEGAGETIHTISIVLNPAKLAGVAG